MSGDKARAGGVGDRLIGAVLMALIVSVALIPFAVAFIFGVLVGLVL